jgi:phosphatidylserine/phosphatidylglycerophosphate/cardiolipin synthase-like enzyme
MLNKEINKKLRKVFVAVSIFTTGFVSYPPLVNDLNKVFQTAFPERAIADTEALKICFTPNQPCLPMVIEAINNAQSSILLLGYSFTSKPITQALIQAKIRGVKVRMVLDHSQQFQKYSKEPIGNLLKEQIEVRFDHSVKIAHNKVLVIDNSQTLTGSYNWTLSAEFKNAENLVFINSPAVAKQYTEYFEERWNISKPPLDKVANSGTTKN